MIRQSQDDAESLLESVVGSVQLRKGNIGWHVTEVSSLLSGPFRDIIFRDIGARRTLVEAMHCILADLVG